MPPIQILMQHNEAQQNGIFQSPSYGELTLDQIVLRMDVFRAENSRATYRLLIGTDSLAGTHHDAALVSAIVFLREGNGGIYFWKRKYCSNLYTLRDRMYQEALASIDVAKSVLLTQRSPELFQGDIEIHVDVGHQGPTRDMIREIVGMVKANGFPVKTKPDSVAASKVADRHTIVV